MSSGIPSGAAESALTFRILNAIVCIYTLPPAHRCGKEPAMRYGQYPHRGKGSPTMKVKIQFCPS